MKILDFRPYAASHDDDNGMDGWCDYISWKSLMYDEGYKVGIFPQGIYYLCKWGADHERPYVINSDDEVIEY